MGGREEKGKGKREGEKLWPPKPPISTPRAPISGPEPRHPETAFDQAVLDAEEQLAATLSEGLWPVVDDRRIYRSSSLGNCISALAAVAQGIEPEPMPTSLQPALDAGTRNEPVILEMFRTKHGYRSVTFPEIARLKESGVIAGYNPELQQMQVRLNVGSGAQIRGHLDDIMVVEGVPVFVDELPNAFMIEAKAFGESLWKAWKSTRFATLPHYELQLSGNMLACGLPAIVVVGHKDENGDVYEIDVETYMTPPVTRGRLLAKVLKADKYAREEEVPLCEEALWPCPIWNHPSHPEKVEVAVEEVDDPVLGELCKLHRAYTDDEAEAKKLREGVKLKQDKHVAEKGYAKNAKLLVTDEAGNRFEWCWVEEKVHYDAKEARDGMRSFPSVKLVK